MPRLLAGWLMLIVGAGRAAADPFRATEWQARQGRWRFEAHGELLCEGRGLSSLLYRRGFHGRDLDFSVEVMFLGPESSAGLFFRAAGKHFSDEVSFYQFEWYTAGRHHGRRLSLMIKNPRWKQIVVPLQRDAPLDRWITFRVRARGEQLEAFIDGQRVFEKRDRTFVRAGAAGLHVFQARPVRFRNARITDGRSARLRSPRPVIPTGAPDSR